jgi:hypothetical protein
MHNFADRIIGNGIHQADGECPCGWDLLCG